jgi:NhaP-type Na+/H+ or K+/H+ antiporter
MNALLRQETLLLLGVVLLVGYYAGGLARRLKLPSLIGFMLLGVLTGPSLMNWLSEPVQHRLGFITDIALGFVAFGIGSELSFRELRKLGGGIVTIIFAESFGAFLLVLGVIWLLTRNLPMALLFGALAPASAPAGTVAVIQEYRAKGSLTQALYAVVGFDDGLAILIFGFSFALARLLLLREIGAAGASGGIMAAMWQPLGEIGLSVLVGTVLGFAFRFLARRISRGGDMLVMTFGIVFVGVGISEHFHLSLILTNMIVGMVIVNTCRENSVRQITTPLSSIMPLVFLLFFALAGAHLQVAELPKLGMVGIVYILARSAGLIGGSRLGAAMGHVEPKIKKLIGLGILSQAGVAIGLSLIITQDFAELARDPKVAEALTGFLATHPGPAGALYSPIAMGAAILTTVTATCIVFEIIGPILTKIALQKAGEIPAGS